MTTVASFEDSSPYDDLLLALSLALWLAEHRPVIYATFHVPQGTIPTQHDRFPRTWF